MFKCEGMSVEQHSQPGPRLDKQIGLAGDFARAIDKQDRIFARSSVNALAYFRRCT